MVRPCTAPTNATSKHMQVRTTSEGTRKRNKYATSQSIAKRNSSNCLSTPSTMLWTTDLQIECLGHDDDRPRLAIPSTKFFGLKGRLTLDPKCHVHHTCATCAYDQQIGCPKQKVVVRIGLPKSMHLQVWPLKINGIPNNKRSKVNNLETMSSRPILDDSSTIQGEKF